MIREYDIYCNNLPPDLVLLRVQNVKKLSLELAGVYK